MTFVCTALYSIEKSRSGFLLPAFSAPESNDTFFQDLSIDGRVERFIRVDTANLFHVPMLPPALNVSIGDFGLLAFLDDNGALEIGIPVELARAIEANAVSDPIVRMELASLRADRVMQKRALRDCREKFAGEQRFASWAKREKRLFRKVIQDFSNEKPGVDETEARLNKEFLEIEADLRDKGWTQRWLRLWGQGYERRRLVGIAYLRQDSNISFDADGPEVFRIILDSEWSLEARQRSLDVLKSTPIEASGWFALYMLAYYRSGVLREDVFRVGLGALNNWLSEKNRKGQPQWISLWQFHLRTGQAREEVRHLGVDFIRQVEVITVSVARNVLVPLARNEQSFEFIEDHILNWVAYNVRSDTVWASLFISSYKFGPVNFLHEIGIDWLRDLGGNLTQWIDIWHLYRNRISDEEYVFLGINWLGRARKDMRSWADVYFELFEDFSRMRDERIVQLGVEWMNSRQGNKSNRRKMSQVLEYMHALQSR